MSPADTIFVEYSVKDLLTEIRADVKSIDSKLESKVSVTDHDSLVHRVQVLESAQEVVKVIRSRQKYVLGTSLIFAGAVGTWAAAIHH